MIVILQILKYISTQKTKQSWGLKQISAFTECLLGHMKECIPSNFS
jgi:hypothetical protein